MSQMDEITIPLKFLVDKGKNKVLFAESDHCFVDILFSFMTLPMGTIARLIDKNSDSDLPSVGCLRTLYQGLANLPSKHFSTEEAKELLLHPRNSSDHHCSKLKLNVDDTEYFICSNGNCTGRLFSTHNKAKCICGLFLKQPIHVKVNSGLDTRGVFVSEAENFMITDDLCVMPTFPGSSIRILIDQGISDTSLIEERTVNIGLKEILKLLMLALRSRSPLTDLLLRETHTVQQSIPGNFTLPAITEDPATSSSKMDIRVFVQKSNGKPMFIQAGEDFIDFIFSFLAIPLGTVLFLLSGNTSAGSIDNLYRSIKNMNVGQYLISQDLKDVLIQPMVAQHYICKNQIFILKEEDNPELYSYEDYDDIGCWRMYLGFNKPEGYNNCMLTFNDLLSPGGYVRVPVTLMVTDDLVVKPLSSISSLSILDKLKVPLSDVEQRAVSIGLAEGLSILKAFLSSSSAISSALNLFLKKPKEEK